MTVAESFPTDPALAGFPRALDAETVRRALQAHALAPRFDCVRCELERFRYRQGERAVILFRVGILDRDTGLEYRTWISGSFTPGTRQGAAMPISPRALIGGMVGQDWRKSRFCPNSACWLKPSPRTGTFRRCPGL